MPGVLVFVSGNDNEGAGDDEAVMRKHEIDALLRAHGNRAQTVAFLHILRQPELEADDHAFLSEHIDDLGSSDLMRWWARCEAGFTGRILQQIARLAVTDPSRFTHEILDAPRLAFGDQEWIELTDLLRGKVPETIWQRVLDRGRKDAAPAEPPSTTEAFDLSSFMDLGGLAPEDDESPAAEVHAPGDLTAMEWASTSDEDWSASVDRLPDTLADAILEKARRTPRANERATLLEWHERRGTPRKILVEIAVASLASGEISPMLVTWLARQLATRSAWEKHGLAIVSALLARRAWPELHDLITLSWSDAGRTRPEILGDHGAADVPRGFLDAVQLAFALALLRLTHESLERRDEARAMAALSALACLDPPSRISRSLHDLRRAPGMSGGILDLLAINERLVKHSDARDASLEGAVAAVHALTDGMA